MHFCRLVAGVLSGVALLFAAHLSFAQLTTTGAGKKPGGGGGSVAVDQTGTTKYQAASNNFNYTGLTITGGLTNSGLVCMLVRAAAALDPSTGVAVTWNSVSMALRKSQIATTGTPTYVFLFGLRNPASGNQTLNVSGTNVSADNYVNCVSFSGVNQTSDALAFPNTTSAQDVTTLSVTSASGHVAVGVFVTTGGLGTILGTTVISDTSGSLVNAGADYVLSVGASTTVGTSTSQQGIAGMDVSN